MTEIDTNFPTKEQTFWRVEWFTSQEWRVTGNTFYNIDDAIKYKKARQKMWPESHYRLVENKVTAKVILT